MALLFPHYRQGFGCLQEVLGKTGTVPMAVAPPLLAPRSLRYHTSAPLAAMLDAVTLPYRTHGSVGSLSGLVRSLAPRSGD